MNKIDWPLHKIFYNITHRCNLRCHYCYASSEPMTTENFLTLSEIESVAIQGKECGAKQILISGGEPFIRKDWLDICKTFEKNNYDISISSNGSLINENILKGLVNLISPPIFQISFDGTDDIINNICGVGNIAPNINNGIDKLIEYGFKVQLNCVLHTTNYFDIPYLVQYSYDKNVPIRFTLLNINYGRGANEYSHGLTVNQVVKTIKALHIARKANPLVELNVPPLLLHPDDWFVISPSCGWARHMCGLLSDGSVTICGLSVGRKELIAGNVRQQNFRDIWQNSKLFTNLRKNDISQLRGICNSCPFIEACGGSCRLTPYMEDGDFLGPNSLCQAYADGLMNNSINENDFPSGMIRLNMFETFEDVCQKN